MSDEQRQDVCPDHQIDEFFCRQLHDEDYLAWWDSLTPFERIRRELVAVSSSFVDELNSVGTAALYHATLTSVLQEKGANPDDFSIEVTQDGDVLTAVVGFRVPPGQEPISLTVIE